MWKNPYHASAAIQIFEKIMPGKTTLVALTVIALVVGIAAGLFARSSEVSALDSRVATLQSQYAMVKEEVAAKSKMVAELEKSSMTSKMEDKSMMSSSSFQTFPLKAEGTQKVDGLAIIAPLGDTKMSSESMEGKKSMMMSGYGIMIHASGLKADGLYSVEGILKGGKMGMVGGEGTASSFKANSKGEATYWISLSKNPHETFEGLAILYHPDELKFASQAEKIANVNFSGMGKEMTESKSESTATMPKELPQFLKTPHYVDSFPKHGDQLTQAPNSIVVNFNFNLHRTKSGATVTRNGIQVPVKILISDDELTMRFDLQGATGDGVWLVKLNACWPDGSCHEGQFAFTVDSKVKAQYEDLKGTATPLIHIANIAFDQPNIIIKKGTRVTWVNDDSVLHFVNTDPHPTHNLISSMNSKGLNKGDQYSYTFTEAGEFGYHCSAHTQMVAKVLVVP